MLSSRYASFVRVLVVTGLSLNVFIVWKDRDLVPKGYPDFTIFYSAGKIVRAGMARSLYDERVEFQTQLEFAPDVSTRHGALPYNHPPFEALLFVPFTFLSYLPAYLAWNAINLALLGLALLRARPHVRLLQTKPQALWLLTAVAYFPIFVSLLQGQDMLLLFFLLAAAYVSLKRGSDLLAGCWLGAGIFRPHLVLPLAIILLFSKKLKVVFGIACSAVCMTLISIAVVGWREFLDYPGYVWRLEQIMGRGAIVPGDMPNLRGFFAIFFRDGQPLALSLTAVSSIFLLILAIRLFRSAEHGGNLELGFSVAVLVAILVSYHSFIYDLGLLFLPMFFLWDKEKLDEGAGIQEGRWALVVPVVTLWFTPLSMFLYLRVSHLNFLTPILFLWLWGIAREISRLKGGGHESHQGVASTESLA